MKILGNTLIIFVISFLVLNCKSKTNEVLEIQEYTGPIREVGPANNYYSDSAVVKMRMEAPRQLDFSNGDSEFPEGLFLEFYDEGILTTTLKADYCYKTAKDELWKATGNVVIQRIDNGDRLDTEELFWNARKEEVFTEKFVRIEKDGDLHLGEGLEAKQDFSYWKILNAQGTLPLSESGNE